MYIVKQKSDNKWKQCTSIIEACAQHPITVDMENSPPTITLEFGLYCENGWKKGLLGSVLFFTSVFITILMSGVITSKYGRKKTLFISYFLGMSGIFLISLSPNYEWALVGYALTSF